MSWFEFSAMGWYLELVLSQRRQGTLWLLLRHRWKVRDLQDAKVSSSTIWSDNLSMTSDIKLMLLCSVLFIVSEHGATLKFQVLSSRSFLNVLNDAKHISVKHCPGSWHSQSCSGRCLLFTELCHSVNFIQIMHDFTHPPPIFMRVFLNFSFVIIFTYPRSSCSLLCLIAMSVFNITNNCSALNTCYFLVLIGSLRGIWK